MRDRGLTTLLTGHQLDDQAETLVMRLNRGSGVTGLAGMRPVATVPGNPDLRLVRPLLGWRRAELEAICAVAGHTPANDPSNCDLRHERVKVRRAIAGADWLDATALARSAGNLAAADDALEWAVKREWTERVTGNDQALIYEPSDAPVEIRRRLVARAVATLANEGPAELRGRELDRLISELEAGSTATLRGVRCEGGPIWRFAPATPRKLAK
jgi:tRNA(Ile)-lysidine synthase